MNHLTRPEGTLAEDYHLSRRSLGKGATSLFFMGYAAAALAQSAKPIITGTTGLIIEEPLIPNGYPEALPAYLARPAAPGRHPVIVVINEVFGIHAYIKDICRRLAHLGYVAIAPAFFYRSKANLPAITDFKQIMAVVSQAGDTQVDSDVVATTTWVKNQPFAAPLRLGITGFCWGGAVVWRSCMINDDFRAGVAWYGHLEKIIPRASALHIPVLGLYGGKDQGIPQADVIAMRAALAAARKTSEIIVYPDAEHGFHADYRASYNPAAANDGWARMLAHFKAHGV